MTKHKNADERRAEILNAAIEEINAKGLNGLTMEGIIARTSLSKGGVYRFFNNKKEIIQAVLWHATDHVASINVEEALAWNLPLVETMVQKTFRRMLSEENRTMLRVMVLLTPEIMNDRDLQAMMHRQYAQLERDYRLLLYGIIQRDNLTLLPGAEERVDTMIGMANSLFHGLSVQAMQGAREEHLEAQLLYFIRLTLQDLIRKEAGDETV